MNLQSTHQLNQFSGIDNVNVPTDLEQINDSGHTYFFQKAENLDLTNKKNMRRRDGYRIVASLTDLHSLWSDGDNCFFMDADKLYRLNADMTHTLLLPGFALRPMNYAMVYGKCYFTNGSEIGWIDDNGVSALPSPTDNFKQPMPPGHLLEFYNQSLYVAVGNILYCSDPTIPAQYDIRHGLIPFKSKITMLKAVDDGLWVSDSEKIYFLQGSTNRDFTVLNRMNVPVLERSAVTIDGRYLGTDSVGKSILMLTSRGICIGSNGGNFLIPTKDRYHGSEFFIVRDAYVRISDNRFQYLVMGYHYPSGESMELQFKFPAPSLDATVNPSWNLPLLHIQMKATTA
jgi:hypothetical protein